MENNKTKNSVCFDVIVWISYNVGRNVYLRSNTIGIEEKYLKATAGNHKYCKCENKPKSVNEFWQNWHCTYCLKPIEPKPKK